MYIYKKAYMYDNFQVDNGMILYDFFREPYCYFILLSPSIFISLPAP